MAVLPRISRLAEAFVKVILFLLFYFAFGGRFGSYDE
jgi:hypothetical protein